MSLLSRAVTFAKTSPALDLFWRYHPLYYAGAQKIATLPIKEQIKVQPELLHRTLKWAQGTAYGRDFRTTDLSDWPYLDKEQIRLQPKHFHGRTLLSLPAKTGGSSGVPLPVWRSVQNIAAETAFFDALLAPHGLTFRTARIAILRGDNIKDVNDTTAPYGVQRGRQLILSFPHLSPTTFPWYKQALADFNPDILWIYPSGGDFLASLYEEHQTHQKIPVIFSSSEMLSDEAFKRLQTTFKAEVINYYGQAERVCFAYQTKPQEAWFVPAYGHVELKPLDAETPEGMKAASIIGTSLWNRAMPLVRYHTGDAVLVPNSYTAEDLAATARGEKPFYTLMGRENEYLLLPNGARVQALNHIPRGANVRQVQLIQDAIDHLEIRVLPTKAYTEADTALLIQNARGKIPESMRITVVTDQQLMRTKAQKTPFVIRRIAM